MNKIILIFFLCVFSSSANAGLKEIGQGEVGTDIQNQIKNQYEKKIKKKKNEDKKFILYFYSDGGNSNVWNSAFANFLSTK